MIYPDTSFLCSLYRQQVFTPRALDFMDFTSEKLVVTSFLLLEFRQSVRLQNWLFKEDRTRGFPVREGEKMLRDLQSDLSNDVLEMASPDWAEVHRLAEEISGRSTPEEGNRLADIMHVATAKCLGADTFLSFDDKQRELAKSQGMELGV
jgi:predicted nucleic acid-binding protein